MHLRRKGLCSVDCATFLEARLFHSSPKVAAIEDPSIS